MTRIARTSSTSRPCWAAWNAWAVPEKLVLMLEGSVCRADLLHVGHRRAE